MIAETMSLKSPQINIISLLNEGIERFGLKEMNKRLKEISNTSYGSRHKHLKKKICDEISAEYGYSAETIRTSTRRGEITQAKAMMMIMFHHHLNMTLEEIAYLFGGKSKSLVSRRIKAFKAYMNKTNLYESEKEFEKIYADKNFSRRFEVINTRINEYKQQWKSNP